MNATIENARPHMAQGLADSLANAGKKDWSRKARSIFCQWWQDEKLMGLALAELKKVAPASDVVKALEMRLSGKGELIRVMEEK